MTLSVLSVLNFISNSKVLASYVFSNHDVHSKFRLNIKYILQIDQPQNTYFPKDVALYGLRWAFSLGLVELITHFFYYNAFALR